MNKQIKYLLGVLILLLIAAYFLSLFSGLPQYFKDDIIAFLEERYSGEISFSSVSLWPLNRLRLESFSFSDENGNFVKIQQLNLDYNFDFSDFDSLIKISFLEAENAEIILAEDFSAVEKGSQAANLNNQNSEAGEFKLASFDLPKFLGDINVNLVNSKLIIKNEDYDLELSNLNLGAAAQSSKDYVLNLSTSIFIDQLSYNNFKLNDFEAEKT
jgi:translocation and assembly module TamB